MPDDGVVDGLAREAVPHERRLALVGDADGDDLLGRDSARGERLAVALHLGGEDVARVVLDPARARIDLAEFAHRLGDDLPPLVKQYCAGTGRSLIECGDDAHRPPLLYL